MLEGEENKEAEVALDNPEPNPAASICSKSLVIKLERLNSELVEELLKTFHEKLVDGSYLRRSLRQPKKEENVAQPEESRRDRNKRNLRKKNNVRDARRKSGRIASIDSKPKGEQSSTDDEEDEVSNKENGNCNTGSESEDGQRRSKRVKAIPKKSPKKRKRHSSDEEYKVDTRRTYNENDSDREFEDMLEDKRVSSSSSYGESSGSDWEGEPRSGGRRRNRGPRKSKEEKEVYSEFAKTITGNGKHGAKDEHHGFCQKCKHGGELVCCLTCRWSHHLLCLNPPLTNIPDGKWQCPRCSYEDTPWKPNKIIGWRWKESKEERENFAKLTATEQMLAYKPQREYLIHWTDQSFWKCSWMPEEQLKLFHATLLRGYDKNVDDLVEEQCVLGNSDDPLYEKFYKYGVDPQWLTVHRIINHRRMFGKNEYLVKWRNTPYNECSWEKEDDKEIPEFKKYQEIYFEWKKVFKGETDYEFKHKNLPPKEPISDLSVKFEGQPPFVDTEGGLRLHDYQLDSLNWLRDSWKKGISTILADEMGLGKTIQAIVFLYSLYKEGHSSGPFLVCAPLSTVVNWEREFELWAPDMYVVTYTGLQDERVVIRENELSESPPSTGGVRPQKVRGALKLHVLLTSYEFITKDMCTLNSISWAGMVVDEGHRLKNNRSKFFENLNNYDAAYKLILSGTPLQNNLQELFNMITFLCPDDSEKLETLQEEFSTDVIDQAEQVKQLHALLLPRLLRRVKEDVLKDLPTKTEIIVKVELSPMQKKYYKYILSKNFEALNSKSGGHWATLMFVFVDLQKCCNHPYLFSTAMMKAPVLESDIYETASLVKASGKLCLLQKLLRGLKEGGNRVLIFSHSVKMLDILEDFLEGEEHEYERIDGHITGAERQRSIDRFNAPDSKIFVFLLSTKAGGLGINLATADTVILYDSDWNPHNDIQAFSRAHRIGQTKKVMIYRFITRHSIEERIAQVARRKLMLNHVILEAGKGDFTLAMSKSQLDGIIRYGTKELFKEDAEYVRDNFTEEVIKDLLDRSKEKEKPKEKVKEEEENGEENTDNDFLSSVKIVSHVKAEDLVEIDSSEEENNEPDFWEKVFGNHGEGNKKKAFDPDSMGKGKRKKKRISYKVLDEHDPFTSESEKEERKKEEELTRLRKRPQVNKAIKIKVKPSGFPKRKYTKRIHNPKKDIEVIQLEDDEEDDNNAIKKTFASICINIVKKASSSSSDDVQVIESSDEDEAPVIIKSDIPPVILPSELCAVVMESDSDEVQVIDSDSENEVEGEEDEGDEEDDGALSSSTYRSSDDDEEDSEFSESEHSIHTVEDSDSDGPHSVVNVPHSDSEEGERRLPKIDIKSELEKDSETNVQRSDPESAHCSYSNVEKSSTPMKKDEKEEKKERGVLSPKSEAAGGEPPPAETEDDQVGVEPMGGASSPPTVGAEEPPPTETEEDQVGVEPMGGASSPPAVGAEEPHPEETAKCVPEEGFPSKSEEKTTKEKDPPPSEEDEVKCKLDIEECLL